MAYEMPAHLRLPSPPPSEARLRAMARMLARRDVLDESDPGTFARLRSLDAEVAARLRELVDRMEG